MYVCSVYHNTDARIYSIHRLFSCCFIAKGICCKVVDKTFWRLIFIAKTKRRENWIQRNYWINRMAMDNECLQAEHLVYPCERNVLVVSADSTWKYVIDSLPCLLHSCGPQCPIAASTEWLIDLTKWKIKEWKRTSNGIRWSCVLLSFRRNVINSLWQVYEWCQWGIKCHGYRTALFLPIWIPSPTAASPMITNGIDWDASHRPRHKQVELKYILI